jgi:hypothetical protein
MQEQLTESEIKKRRRILFGKFGTYAFAMTDEQIRAIYEKMPDKFSQHSNQTTHKRRSLNDNSRGSNI